MRTMPDGVDIGFLKGALFEDTLKLLLRRLLRSLRRSPQTQDEDAA